VPAGVEKMTSVSTKLATLPSSSMPRALKRVPALRQDRRDSNVNVEGNPEEEWLIGEEAGGTVKVMAKPRIADVSMREASSSLLSCSDNLERKLTSGWIMYEFHKNPASRLSIATVADNDDLI
jgi:hypothetical protein